MTYQHVAFYMHDLSGGGVERMRLSLIAQLRDRGLDVRLVLAAREGSLTVLLPPDLAVDELGSRGMLDAVYKLARYLRRVRPEILIASLDHNNITAILACLIARVPTRVVICQHNALSAEQAMGWRYRMVPWLYRLLYQWADGIIAVSGGVADDLAATAGIPRERISTIYNPVIGPDFAGRTQAPPPHSWLAKDRACPVFVFAGRLTGQKDPAMLLDAMALLLLSRPARLILLGEGDLRSELECQAIRLGIAERVMFVGFQANPLPWIRHADALVSTSRYEGLGNAIIEALGCGTAVIATDCPHGPSEILLDGRVGRLVPVGDSAALAAAMQAEVDTRPDKLAMMARAGAFTAETCADAHESLFNRILANRRQIRAFGLHFSALQACQVVRRVMTEPAADGLRLIVTPNLDHLRLLRHPNFAAAYAAAHLICPDGFPVLLYARWRGLRLNSRVTGCELFHRLANHPHLQSHRLCIVVESPGTKAAVSAWSARLGFTPTHPDSGPGVDVLLAPDGLAGDLGAQSRLAASIRNCRPSILVMTLGAPVSETFVHQHRDTLPSCWALCVGQAVRVELGLVERAPQTWRRLGLEWLWRIRQEPRRLAGRYLKALAWFPVAVLRDLQSTTKMYPR